VIASTTTPRARRATTDNPEEASRRHPREGEQMNEATRILSDEHQVILGVLGCLEAALREVEDGSSMTLDDGRDLLAFFRGYADRVHHGKEEVVLFPLLEELGIPREGGPIGVMLHEHDLGRAALGRFEAALEPASRGDDTARAQLLEAGRFFLGMLREHIEKEDHCLFPMACQSVPADELGRLLEAYRAADAEPARAEEHARCLTLARRLGERFATPIPIPGEVTNP
jgi:hemerythrin-like domain-containing protein